MRPLTMGEAVAAAAIVAGFVAWIAGGVMSP